MSIFDRMGRVIQSNVNALLDRAEDPKKSVDFVVEEMKDQIKLARKELVEGLAAEKVLRKKVEELDADVERWDKRAELALKANDEKLAREALVQKKRAVAERDRSEALRGEQRAAVLNMKSELERMENKQQELEARKNVIASQLQAAKGGGGGESLGARGTGGAFAEFRRMEDKIEGSVAEASAMKEVEDALGTGHKESLEARFAVLEGKTGGAEDRPGGVEVDAELAALKKRVRVGS